MPRSKPNVVFVFGDQWRAQATGYAGNPNVKTPHLDALARESVNLTTAISGCPVCSPYRASLLTGQYPLTHGVFLNDVCLSRDAVSLADAFGSAGYRTAYIGKWHLDGHGRSNFTPPERRQGFDFWRALECTHSYNHSVYYADTPEKRVWDGYDAMAQTRAAQRYIREADRDAPFLLVLSWGPPHNPYHTAPDEFRRLYRPEDIVLRPNVPEGVAKRARKDLAGYYAHCSALDACVGDLLSTLDERGLAEDTVFVFTSDHGDMHGSHGVWRKQPPYDEAVRVPFLLRWPAGLGRQGREVTIPVSAPDLVPTLLGLCGLDVPKTVEGTDLSRVLLGEEETDHDAGLIAAYAPFGEWPKSRGGREYRGVRTSRYTYVRTLDGPWLLFDNEEDPYQQRNLANTPAAADLQAELEAVLSRLLAQTGDRFEPAEAYIQRWGYPVDANGTVPYTP
jgi:arylsulfatase A-like enzyme